MPTWLRCPRSIPLAATVLILLACGEGPVAPPELQPVGCGAASTDPRVATVTLSTPRTWLALGDTMRATATARNAAGDVVPVEKFTWTVSDSTNSVSSCGLVYAHRIGPVTVSATAEGVTGSIELTVRDTL